MTNNTPSFRVGRHFFGALVPVEAACATIPGLVWHPIAADADWASETQDIEALVINNDGYTAEVADALARAPRLRGVQFTSTGYDRLMRYGGAKHVLYASAGPIWAPACAEHAMALLLALTRGVPTLLAQQAAGNWDRTQVTPKLDSLEGRHLLILGLGGIGQETAKRARCFGLTITALTRRPPEATAAALVDHWVLADGLLPAAARADAVIAAVPASAETRGLIGRDFLAALKPGAVIVNVARGEVIDDSALLEALERGTVRGAALDVFEPEPLPSNHPYWTHPRVLLSPHVAGFGGDAGFQRMAAVVARNLGNIQAGRVLENAITDHPRTAR